MSWKEELRASMGVALGIRKQSSGADVAEETDADRREILQATMAAAAKVMKFARGEFALAELDADFESNAGYVLTVEKRVVAVILIMNGLAITVRRETGVVDLLHVEDGVIVDGQRRPIGRAEAYFGRLVVELARSVKSG